MSSSRHLSALACATISVILPVIASAQDTPDDGQRVTFADRWGSNVAIEARPTPRGAFTSLGLYNVSYQRRSLRTTEFTAGVGITDNVSVWLATQDFHVQGRKKTSTLDLNADTYGIKWVVRPPRERDARSLAIELETFRPGTATAVTKNASATFLPVQATRFALDYAFRQDLQAQLGYANVRRSGVGNGDVLQLGLAKDWKIWNVVDARLQGHVIEQSYNDAVGRTNAELKTMFYGALGYRVNDWSRIEVDSSWYPSGLPLSAGRLTSLSGLQLYRPGGAAKGLRTSSIFVGAIRLNLTWKF